MPPRDVGLEHEVEEEFRFHLDMKTAALVERGVSPDEARARALKDFGNLERLRREGARQLRRATRVERRGRRRDALAQDVRAGVKALGRRPGFTATAVGTLALGLTASTSVFTYVNAYAGAVPGADPDRVYQVYFSSEQSPWGQLSFPDFRDLEAAGDGAFRAAAVGAPRFAASARHTDFTEVVFGEGVTGDLFGLLDIDVGQGRGLSATDDAPGAPAVTVISDAYWLERFGGDPNVVGRTLRLNDEPYTVVGVADPQFLGMTSAFRPDVWIPFEQFKRVYWARSRNETDRNARTVSPYVKLGASVGDEEAGAILDALARGLDASAPLADGTRRFTLAPATWISPTTRDSEASTARIMLLAAAGLLLMACANVANMVLSAGARRQEDLAARKALGATGGRLAQQLLVENVLVSITAGALALALAEPIANRLSAYFARPSVWGANVPRIIDVDPRVMLFALGVALVSGAVTGLLPAARLFGRDLAPILRGAAAGIGGHVSETTRVGLQGVLVATQLAFSVVLVFVASLVLRTLDTAASVDVGFDVDRTLASYVSTSSMGVAPDDRHAFFGTLIDRLEAVDGIREVTVAENAPLSPHPSLELSTSPSSEPAVAATVARVWPGYVEQMGIELLQGRTFAMTDTAGAPDVAIVNETLARALTGDAPALGTRIYASAGADGAPRSHEVVGVVRDVRQTSLLDPVGPVAYFSLLQHYSAPGNGLVLRVEGSHAAQVARVERALRDVDARLAIVNVLPYRDVVRGFLYVQRMNAELFSLCAALGLLLVGGGLFSTVALSVARRRHEIGLRMALGATRPGVVKLVLLGIGPPLAIGLVGGLGGSWLASDLVRRLLWDVRVTDPVALAVGGAAIVTAITTAVFIPVRRALRVDPVASLKAE